MLPEFTRKLELRIRAEKWMARILTSIDQGRSEGVLGRRGDFQDLGEVVRVVVEWHIMQLFQHIG